MRSSLLKDRSPSLPKRKDARAYTRTMEFTYVLSSQVLMTPAQGLARRQMPLGVNLGGPLQPQPSLSNPFPMLGEREAAAVPCQVGQLCHILVTSTGSRQTKDDDKRSPAWKWLSPESLLSRSPDQSKPTAALHGRRQTGPTAPAHSSQGSYGMTALKTKVIATLRPAGQQQEFKTLHNKKHKH